MAENMVTLAFRHSPQVRTEVDSYRPFFPRADGRWGKRADVIRALVDVGLQVWTAPIARRLDAVARSLGVSRSEAMRQALEKGLAALEVE